MNIEYARTIGLRDILDKIGLSPTQENNTTHSCPTLSVPSPGAILEIDTASNTWLDTATRAGGGPVELAQAYLRHQGVQCTVSDALHWLKFNIGYPPLLSYLPPAEIQTAQPEQYALRFKTVLQERGLIRFVRSHGISVSLARQFVKQVYIRNKATGKEFIAMGLKNEEGGYAIHSPFISTHLAPRAVAFIRGEPGTTGVRLFMNVFEFLIALTGRGSCRFREDSMILTSYDCLDNAAAYIRGYGYRKLYTGFDSTPSGNAATKACSFLAATEPCLLHILADQQGGK